MAGYMFNMNKPFNYNTKRCNHNPTLSLNVSTNLIFLSVSQCP